MRLPFEHRQVTNVTLMRDPPWVGGSDPTQAPSLRSPTPNPYQWRQLTGRASQSSTSWEPLHSPNTPVRDEVSSTIDTSDGVVTTFPTVEVVLSLHPCSTSDHSRRRSQPRHEALSAVFGAERVSVRLQQSSTRCPSQRSTRGLPWTRYAEMAHCMAESQVS
jgi:hypothetical protein